MDLAAVLTWYKYGNDPNTITCGPSSTVYKSINVAQLNDNTLKYTVSLTGEDSRYVEITGVSVAAGDGSFREVSQNGNLEIELPEGNGDRNYTFRVTGYIEKNGEDGEKVHQELTFQFVLKCEYTLGWNGTHGGTLDTGYYLQSLTTGHTANALEGGMWPGSTEEEVLAAIDARFGAGTGLATLWRCLYRNGLTKSTGSGGTFGEMDYTSGSGWMYSVGGATYYPGQSMSHVYLQDGDVLTIRFTLAYGWDVGGGSPGYGSTVGYCVSAVNGSIRVNHRMETITNEDGSQSNVCHRVILNCLKTSGIITIVLVQRTWCINDGLVSM